MEVVLEQVADSLLRIGLLTDTEISDARKNIERSGKPLSGMRLLAHLKAEGKLTAFQAKRVAQGLGSHLLLGNYLILNRVGEGGMGTVYKALHRKMERVVAVKVIRKDCSSSVFVERFRREIQAAARLNHPHVVAAYDADECELGEFLVMEYIEGANFEEILDKAGPLSVAETIATIRQAAMALGYAHSQGIVHRDIKPANLMRDVNGVVKVADLGLASVTQNAAAAEKQAALTQAGTVAGTVDFMPPEQSHETHLVDHRADIYSLGCTLFFLLAARPVFSGGTMVARVLAHREQTPESLCELRDDVPSELNAIFQRMVAKLPDDRFQSMEDVVASLRSIDAVEADAETTTWNPTETSVLLVESSKMQAGMIRRVVNELQIDDVVLCHTGEETLESLAATRASIVMTSMQLPDMTGVELAERIRSELRWSRVAVLLMTSGQLSEGVLRVLRRLAGVGALQKPFNAVQLQEAITRLLDQEARHDDMVGLSELRVLVVDDSSVARRRIQQVLTDLGFAQFTCVTDGTDAITELENQTFDLVVTDYNMPKMNGNELLAYIRSESSQPDVPIIMVTTEFDPLKLAEIYQLGVSAICNKSFDPELVRNIIVRLFL
ncbi:MAG: response regulator [Planctomycetes bacterium]|nr:response regulator [Planctomycetota bacterium]